MLLVERPGRQAAGLQPSVDALPVCSFTREVIQAVWLMAGTRG
jgi:hypothetical protein